MESRLYSIVVDCVFQSRLNKRLSLFHEGENLSVIHIAGSRRNKLLDPLFFHKNTVLH